MRVKPPSMDATGPNQATVILSAFVCPGAGQFYQRRWFAAIFYMGATLALLARLIWISIVPFYGYVYTLLSASDPAAGLNAADFGGISLRSVALTLAGLLAIYLLNVVDVAIVNALRARTARARLLPPDLPVR